ERRRPGGSGVDRGRSPVAPGAEGGDAGGWWRDAVRVASLADPERAPGAPPRGSGRVVGDLEWLRGGRGGVVGHAVDAKRVRGGSADRLLSRRRDCGVDQWRRDRHRGARWLGPARTD